MGEPGISSEISGLFPSRFGEIFHVLEIFRNERKLFFTSKYFSEKVTVKSFGIFFFFESKKFRKNIFFKNPGRIRKFFREFF